MRAIKGRDRQQVKKAETYIHEYQPHQCRQIDYPGKRKIPYEQSGHEGYGEIGKGSCKGHEDNAFPDVFEVSGIYRNGLGPPKVKKKETDCPERVNMRQGIECKPAHLFCRWISKPQGYPAVGVLVHCDGE